jgi:tyrosine-protein kinase Etk/Wzc
MLPEASFYHYWQVLRRRKHILATAFLASLGTCAVYVRTQPTIYQASSLLRFLPQGLPDETQTIPPVATLMRQELDSAGLARKAAVRMGLASSTAAASEIAAQAGTIGGLYAAGQVNEQGFFRINVKHTDRVFASELANAVAESFLEQTAEEAGKQARENISHLSSRAEQVQKSLDGAERARQDFLEKNGPSSPAEALSAKIGDLEFQKKDLLAKYTHEHPSVIELERRLSGLRAELAKVPARETELGRLTREVRTNEELFAALSKQLEQTRVAAASIPPLVQIVERATPPARPVSPDIPRSYSTSAALGLILGILLSFFFETLDLSISNIEEIERFIDMPVIAIIPNFSSLASPPGLRKPFRRLVRSSTETDRGLMLLTQFPLTKSAEPYHALRANLLSRRPPGSQGTSLLFASSSSDEGKTLCSLNFAFAAATSGLKVLLVDMDTRRPCVHRMLGLARAPGISDVMSGKADWPQALQGSADFLMSGAMQESYMYYPGIDNLKIIAAGADVPNKMNLFESPRIAQLCGEWKQRFDFVVFDTPPVLLFVDTLLLARSVDAVVLLYGAGKATRMALKRAKEQMQGFAKDKLIGIAINNLQTADLGAHYGSYYQDQ